MKTPQVILCLASASLGSLLTLAIAGGDFWRPANAQERRAVAAERPASDRLPAERSPADRGAGANRLVAQRLPADEVSLTSEERVNVAVYENVNRSVVNINTKSVRNDNFFSVDIASEGAGSGSVLDTRGHVLTNFHVVNAAKEIQVTLFDGKSYDATVVGKDELNDVAVLKIDAPPASLIPVLLGESAPLKVGQRVYAIGNPFGLERTLTTGIISSLNRTLPTRSKREIRSIIQIDAAINPGNSGGPLLDSRGRLIGMNTAIASSTGQSAGVGFAVPVDSIARVVPQLIERGRVIRPDAGISRVLQTEKGLLIATLIPKGPAETAGLRGFRIVRQKKNRGPFSYETQSIDRNAADLIVAVNGEKITTANDFLSLVEARQPGEEVTITVIRDGHEVIVPLRLASSDS